LDIKEKAVVDNIDILNDQLISSIDDQFPIGLAEGKMGLYDESN
jgi:hypothetical protein